MLAGDTLSLDADFSFYIVIDGNVQVFAPLAQPAANAGETAFDDEGSPEYQLLNEVGSGGTLSSLFTILSLFSEDIHLGTADDASTATASAAQQHDPATALRRRASALRPGSDQLQLNAAALRNVPNAHSFPLAGVESANERYEQIPGMNKRSLSAVASADGADTVQADADASIDSQVSPQFRSSSGERAAAASSPVPHDPLPPAQAAAPFTHFNASTSPVRSRASMPRRTSDAFAPSSSPGFSASGAGYARTESMGRPQTPGSLLSGYSAHTNRASASGHANNGPSPADRRFMPERIGTIGRATTDTTLAVIPAEAFKRLTRRYPSSAAHIIQVILTRLSRVTFHTAHKYLGLTKEIMRTEMSINEVASFALPASFYEQGGIERLRQRFSPEARRQSSRDVAVVDEQDYFRSADHEGNQTPNLRRRDNQERAGDATVTSPTRAPTTPWGHPEPVMRPAIARSHVGPGDLFSMTGSDDLTPFGGGPRQHSGGHGAFDSPDPPASTGQRRRRRSSLDSVDGKRSSPATSGAAPAMSEVNLKDEILECMSKAIGLTTVQNASPLAGNDASPALSAQDAPLLRNTFSSSFGSLSLLDRMMYEDEQSSFTGNSSFAGAPQADLENEVEVNCFPAGSTLVKAGESKTGLFYVIDGFLDVSLPAVEGQALAGPSTDVSSPIRPNEERRPPPPSSSHLHPPRKRAEAGRGPANTLARLNEAKTKAGGAQPKVAASKFGNALDGTKDRASVTPRSGSPLHGLRNGQIPSGGAKATGMPQPEDADRQRDALTATKSSGKPIYTVGRGGLAGYLSSLLGSASFVEIKAKTDVYVGYLPAKALERIMESRPAVLLTLSKRLLTLLSPLILYIDSALDWQQVNAGHVIYREGDVSDSFYIVINGRLRAMTERSGAVEIIGEYGQGDSVGELDVITSSPRQKTLHAIRDSELVRMPMTLFNAVAVRHPQIAIQISRIIGRRVRQEVINRNAAAHTLRTQIPGLPDLGRNNANLKTVAIVPVTREVPIVEFANKLQTAFEDTIGGPTAFLNQSSVMSVLGRHAFNRMGKLKLAGWLSEQEQKYRLVLYVVDTVVSSPWAQTSIRQADSVLLVGFGDDPSVGEYERLLLSVKTTARKELVLLHPERSVPPGSTREWLKSRPWLNAHHHVEMPGITRSHAEPMTSDPSAVQALKNLKEKLGASLQRYRIKSSAATAAHGRPHHFSDFARLARRLCGKSIGLVLGGGGARGCAHVGVVQALEERGVPIDMIGGTSIGSLIGGLYAKEGEVVSSYGRVKKFSARMGSLWRFASDLTYPVVSYTTGHEFNRGIFKALADTHIEDMWLPFFCNTTNITWSRMEVHTTGYAWRYIRGSMTLAGLIPPLVDEGDMLVDGGYVDNLPVSVMLAMGAKSVFAVDVGSIDDTSPRSYGDTLSGWWVLLNKWNPWSDARNIPSIPDIQGRLTYVSSVKTLEEAKRIPGCFYMRMPVEGFGTLQFGSFNEISKIGYAAGSKMLDEWADEGKLPTGLEADAQDASGWEKRRRAGTSARRNSV